MAEHTTTDDEAPADGITWEQVDAVAAVLTGTAQTPSALARKAKVTTYVAWRCCRWLEGQTMATGEGNGAHRRWRERRFGEGY